jgi:hypothetical protein
MNSEREGINPAAKPSGTGCVECSGLDGWWLHLRRCAECGHIGCCDSSPNQHASKHSAATGHRIHRETFWLNGGKRGCRIEAMDPECYRARAAGATRKAGANLFNSHTYRESACCYERLAEDSDQQSFHPDSAARSSCGVGRGRRSQ